MIAISKRWEEKQNAVMISSNLCNFQETLLPVQICRGQGRMVTRKWDSSWMLNLIYVS